MKRHLNREKEMKCENSSSNRKHGTQHYTIFKSV